MGIRDKTVKGVSYDDFLSIDKDEDGCYTLKKRDGNVLKTKLAVNQAGALKNYFRRKKRKSAPTESTLPSESRNIAQKRETHLFNESPSVETISQQRTTWLDAKFIDGRFKPVWVRADNMHGHMDTGLFEKAYWDELEETSVDILRKSSNPGTNVSETGQVFARGLFLLKTTEDRWKKWQQLHRRDKKQQFAQERTNSGRVDSQGITVQRTEG